MLFYIFTILALALGAIANPLPEVDAHLEPRVAATNLVKINSKT